MKSKSAAASTVYAPMRAEAHWFTQAFNILEYKESEKA